LLTDANECSLKSAQWRRIAGKINALAAWPARRP
jgi:hypothetical protein